MKAKTAKIIGCTPQFLGMVIRGQRSFSLDKARVAVHVIGGNIELWMDTSMHSSRAAMWRKYTGNINKQAGGKR